MSFGGSFFCRVWLYIDANNAGTGLPVPGNRTGGARSAERWIGFNRSPECKILSPVEEQGFQLQRHATGLDHAHFCQLSVFTAEFLFFLSGFFLGGRLWSNWWREPGPRRRTFILSDVEPSSQTYHCFCPLCISSLGIICQSPHTCL